MTDVQGFPREFLVETAEELEKQPSEWSQPGVRLETTTAYAARFIRSAVKVEGEAFVVPVELFAALVEEAKRHDSFNDKLVERAEKALTTRPKFNAPYADIE